MPEDQGGGGKVREQTGRGRSKSVGDQPSRRLMAGPELPGSPEETTTAPQRSKSTAAVVVTAAPAETKKPAKKKLGIYHSEEWKTGTKTKRSTDKLDLGGGVTARGEAVAGVKVGAEGKAGISNNGLVVEGEVTVQAKAALKGKVEGRIADMDATGAAKLQAAGKANAGIGLVASLSEVKAEASAGAKATLTAAAAGTLKISDRQKVSAGGVATAYAEADASASFKVGKEGIKTGAEASAGVGAKVGTEFGGTEGDNCFKYSPSIVFGKVGAGVKGGITHKDGKLGLDVKYTGNLGIGFEINLKAQYSTEQARAALNQALEDLRKKQTAINAGGGNSFADKTDRTVKTINAHISVVSDYGERLAEQGKKQGGFVGTLHRGSGTAIKFYGDTYGRAYQGVVGAGGAVVKAGEKVVDLVAFWR